VGAALNAINRDNQNGVTVISTIANGGLWKQMQIGVFCVVMFLVTMALPELQGESLRDQQAVRRTPASRRRQE
jgi:hypothetical protein